MLGVTPKEKRMRTTKNGDHRWYKQNKHTEKGTLRVLQVQQDERMHKYFDGDRQEEDFEADQPRESLKRTVGLMWIRAPQNVNEWTQMRVACGQY